MKRDGFVSRRLGLQRGSVLRRQVRYLRSALGSSALRRPTDRCEALVRVGLGVLAVVATVLVVVSAVTTTARFSERVAPETASRHRVEAVVVRQAPTPPTSEWGALPEVSTSVRWSGADGSWHFGRADMPAGTAAGTTTAVWLDREGNQVSAPLHRSDAVFTGLGMGLGGEAAVLGLCWLAGFGARKLLDRRRLADWERAWTAADAQWRGHGHQNPR